MFGVRYSVYKQPGDMPVAIHKNRLQCAAAMGVTLRTFDSYTSAIRHSARSFKKWEIIRHEEEEDDE